MIPALPPDFGPFQGRTWLNAAHQGPLPRAARRAIQAATNQQYVVMTPSAAGMVHPSGPACPQSGGL